MKITKKNVQLLNLLLFLTLLLSFSYDSFALAPGDTCVNAWYIPNYGADPGLCNRGLVRTATVNHQTGNIDTVYDDIGRENYNPCNYVSWQARKYTVRTDGSIRMVTTEPTSTTWVFSEVLVTLPASGAYLVTAFNYETIFLNTPSCFDKCETEHSGLVQSCGGEEAIESFDYYTCKGKCKECYNNCAEENYGPPPCKL